MNNKNCENIRFHHKLPIQLRFNDVDRYGHVNNNAYFAYYDLGKDAYLRQVLGEDFRHEDVVPVIANIDADFISPVFFGDKIEVETAISHIGQKSFTLSQQAVKAGTGEVVCRCNTVMVCFSLKRQCSADMPDKFRESIIDFEQDKDLCNKK